MSDLPFQSEYKHLLRQRKPRDKVKDWPQAAELALVLIGRGMSTIRAARILQVPQPELVRLLNSASYVQQYARAERERAAYLAEEALTIADDSVNDPDPNSRRLRVDTRKWFAARMDPKRWGDRIQLPDEATEQQRALQVLGQEAARIALSGIVASIGYQLAPAQPADTAAIPGESRDITPKP